jgi:hypothetical protein
MVFDWIRKFVSPKKNVTPKKKIVVKSPPTTLRSSEDKKIGVGKEVTPPSTIGSNGAEMSPILAVTTRPSTPAPPPPPVQPIPSVKGENMEDTDARNQEIEEDDDSNFDDGEYDDDMLDVDDVEQKALAPPPSPMPPHAQTNPLQDWELKKKIFEFFENDPDIDFLDIKHELDSQRCIDANGEPISMARISRYKKDWLGWVRKREERAEQLMRVKEMEGELGVTPLYPKPGGNEAQYVDEMGQPLQPPPKQKRVAYQPVPAQAPPQQQFVAQPNPAPFVLPPRMTRLEILFQQLDSAIKQNNPGLARIVADGIYAEYDRGGEGGGNDNKMWGLMSTMVSGMFNKQMTEKSNPMKDMRDMAGLMKELMPDRGSESETVQMTKAVGEIVHHTTGELKDTILTVTGHRDDAGKVGVCPYCNKMIPADSLVCSYCGGRLASSPQAGVYPEPQEQIPQNVPPPAQPPMQSTYARPPTPNPIPPVQSQIQASPVQQSGGSTISKDIEQYKKSVKKLTNYIAQKDNPNSLINFGWKFLDAEEKEKAVLAVVIGKDRLYYCVDRLAPQYPDMAQQIELLKSVDGRAWVESALKAIEEKAREEKVRIQPERFALLLKEIQDIMGFEIPDKV